jgi:TetR/AcrR family transcriptional regulator, fatty acid metabolism regulator protein
MSTKGTRRQSIVQAAIEVFGEKTFQSSSIAEIAGKANVAEGTIYQYFANKQDLFFSIPIEKTNEFCEQLDLHLEGIAGASNKIRKFIWYYLYFFKTNPEYGKILLLEMRVDKGFVQTETYTSIRRSTEKILEIIREGQREGTVRKDVSPYVIRQLILGPLEHMVTRWLLKGQKYDLMDQYGQTSELILSGARSENQFL